MARWRLTQPHYLAVPGTEWEYKETDRETGRQARKVFEVPLHLDPTNAADWNYRDQEAIIVTNKFDPAFRKDYLFVGSPTPDMDPLDDEAQQITDEIRNSGAWIHPIDSLNMNYSQSVLSDFERQLAQLLAGAQQQAKAAPQSMSLGGVSQEAFDKLQQQVALLMERNAQLEEAMVEKKAAGRRV
jgi:hypothetical protein